MGEDFRKIYSQKLQKEDFIHGVIIASIHVSWNKFYVAICTVKANSLKWKRGRSSPCRPKRTEQALGKQGITELPPWIYSKVKKLSTGGDIFTENRCHLQKPLDELMSHTRLKN